MAQRFAVLSSFVHASRACRVCKATFLNINVTKWRMLIKYFQNYWRHRESQKMD